MRINHAATIVIITAVSFATVSCGGSPSTPSVPTAPQRSTLIIASEPGDIIGGGRTHRFTAEDALFRIDPPNPGSIAITVLSNDRQSYWSLYMGAPTGQELQVASYPDAVRWTSVASSRPRFSLSGRLGCNSEGQFSILELVRGTPVQVSSGAMIPSIERLHVLFRQRCTETSAPGLTGELWYVAASSQ